MTPREANADLLAEITALRGRVASQGRQIAELQGALAQATHREAATSEILRIISQSPTDVQPVFDAIVESAVRLCDGAFGALATFNGELMHLVATHNWTPRAHEVAGPTSPAHPSRDLLSGRAILERTEVHVPDVELAPEYKHEIGGAVGFRSGLAVPMLRDGVPLGVIGVGRIEPGRFSDSKIALLRTFADQAVIAIENVRLFKELEARNRDLTDALERETATGKILRVISGSPTDIQPVLDAVAESATRLCAANDAVIFRLDGDVLRPAAHSGPIPAPTGFVIPATRSRVHGRA